MSLREELEYVIGRRQEYNDAETGHHWDVFASAAYRLIRDHGQALVEAVDDAERWRTFCHLTSIMDPSFVDSFERIVPDSDNPEDILKAMNQAIDTARRKTVDGGGV